MTSELIRLFKASEPRIIRIGTLKGKRFQQIRDAESEKKEEESKEMMLIKDVLTNKTKNVFDLFVRARQVLVDKNIDVKRINPTFGLQMAEFKLQPYLFKGVITVMPGSSESSDTDFVKQLSTPCLSYKLDVNVPNPIGEPFSVECFLSNHKVVNYHVGYLGRGGKYYDNPRAVLPELSSFLIKNISSFGQ